MPLSTLQFWALNAIGVICLVAVGINISYFQSNRELRTSATQRQQLINQGARISQVNTEIIKALARLSANSNDDSLRALLNEEGISFRVTAPEESAESK